MFNIFNKRIVVIEYKDTISIYDSFEKVRNDISLLTYIKPNMKLKVNSFFNKVVLSSSPDSEFLVTIYSISKTETEKLPDEIRSAVDYFFSTNFLDRKKLNRDAFHAYSLRIN